jgi:hypothetical protein
MDKGLSRDLVIRLEDIAYLLDNILILTHRVTRLRSVLDRYDCLDPTTVIDTDGIFLEVGSDFPLGTL